MPKFIPNIQPETYAKLEKLIDERWEDAKIKYDKPAITRKTIQNAIYAIYGLVEAVDTNTHLKPKKEELKTQIEYAN